MRLIDADNLVSLCKIMADKTDSPQIWEQTISMIESVPTIEAEPVKHGRWETEVRTVLGAKVPFFACSVCGSNADDEYAYCPHCGAKMNTEEGEGHEQN